MDGNRKRKFGSASKQILTALTATVPTFTYGVQLGWPSPMADILKSPDDTPAAAPLTDSAISWLATAFPLAAIVGIPFFSYSSDRFGRKISIIAISFLQSISWTIKLTTVTATNLIIARVIAGLAASGCFVVIPVYIKEISEDAWRGSLASLTMTMCKLGVIFVYAVGMTMGYYGNQAVYLSVSTLHVIAFSFMPESPNYLLKIGEEKKAAKAISWLRKVERSDELVMEEIRKLKDEKRKFDDMPEVTFMSIVRDRATFSAVRMTLVLMGMQTLSGCFALMTFASDVFKMAGAHWSPNGLALFMGSLQLAGSFFTTMSIDKFGRKIPLALSSLIVCLCMTTIATCFALEITASWPKVAAVCLALLAYGVGLAPVPFVVMAEVFTFQVRARMAGVSMAFSFFCSSMTVLFYKPIVDSLGAYVIFYLFAAVTLFGVGYTVFCVPETRGKTLRDIRAYWQKESDTEPVYT